MHKLVNARQYVYPTHQPTLQCISKCQPTCLFSTTNKSMHHLVNVNQHVDLTHQPTRQCIIPLTSTNLLAQYTNWLLIVLVCIACRFNTTNMSKLEQYIGSDWCEFEIYVIVNRNSMTKLYTMKHFIQREGKVSWSVFQYNERQLFSVKCDRLAGYARLRRTVKQPQ